MKKVLDKPYFIPYAYKTGAYIGVYRLLYRDLREEPLMHNVKDILEKAITLLEEKGWFQHKATVTGQLCLVASLAWITKQGEEYHEAYNLLSGIAKGSSETYFFSLMEWNDAPGRTKEEVIELLKKGIASCV